MASALIIPGVQVKTVFEPSGVLPSVTGILGIVGVTDRGPLAPTAVGNMGELLDAFGPGTRYSMPEAKIAFANGVSEIVVSRTPPGRGQRAMLDLLNDDGDKVVTLIARAEGAWGNRIGVQATQVRTSGGSGVKYVNLTLFLDGERVETFNNLTLDEESPDYLFDRVNFQSRLVVAIDPLFASGLPAAQDKAPLSDAAGRAAFATLKAGATDVVRAEAKRVGRRGNAIAARVTDAPAGLTLQGAGNAPSIDIKARKPGPDGTNIRVSVVPSGADAVSLVITAPPAASRTIGPFASVNDLTNGTKNDPDIAVDALGTVLPASLASTQLQRRINVEVVAEGAETTQYTNLGDLNAVAAINDPLVAFSIVGNATALPDANPGEPLRAGRDKGAALMLSGDAGDQPLLELQPVAAGQSLAVTVVRAVSSADHATPVVNLTVFANGAEGERYTDLTMDPDDPQYLPAALTGSALIRAHDLFMHSRASSFPANMVRSALLTGGLSPLPDDYQDALDRLESAEEVDLVIASVGKQLDDNGIRAVHRAVVGHCTKMADVARNRIGIGSVTTSENGKLDQIIDHANDVRSDHFILLAPAGGESAMAGLLSRQDYFQSPTYKTVSDLSAAETPFTDSTLERLITGNVVAIARRRNLGVIVVKGILTSGRQINVQRTANKAVRDVKAICDIYVGLLNNEGARNALRQQITAMFLQMARDGAIVPSTDGKDPPFTVDVYSTEADFANGIVRVDIGIRPVRAIDYIYSTIFVKN